MPHGCFAGMTASGKTFGAQQVAKGFRRAGVGVLVLAKPGEVWPAGTFSRQTWDKDQFLKWVFSARRCACFIEIADADVKKYDERFHKLATEGRHLGHRFYFLAQRAARVHPDIRENCHSLYLFTCGGAGAKVWADEFCDEALLKAATLPQYHFMHKATRYTPAVERVFKV